MARLSTSLQEDLITILAFSKNNGQIVANIADPATFEGDYRVIAERCINYWNKHKEPPGVNTQTLFDDLIEDKHNRRGVAIRNILISMQRLYNDNPNETYILTKLNLHQRTHALKAVITEAAELLNYKQELAIDDVESLFAKVGAARNISFDPGIYMTNVDRLLESLHSTVHPEFMTGIKPLDDAQIVPHRKELMVFIAPSGRGKSWFLAHMVKQAYLLRKKVLYITLELSEDQVLQRCWREVFSVAKTKEDNFKVSLVSEVSKDERGDYVYEMEEMSPEFTFSNPNVEEELNRRLVLHERRMQNVLIKQFPTRSLTIGGLRGYLDSLETVERFVPDLLIIDYPKLMKIDPNNLRVLLGATIEDIRGICVERNMAGVIPHQSTREGASARRVRGIHVSEDFSIYQTADSVITYSSTDEEALRGLARLYVEKSRSDRDHFGVLITQSYALGQFVITAIPLPKNYDEADLRNLNDNDDDNDQDDNNYEDDYDEDEDNL